MKKKDAAILNEINYLENISQSGMNIQMACNLMYFETYLIIKKILILICTVVPLTSLRGDMFFQL